MIHDYVPIYFSFPLSVIEQRLVILLALLLLHCTFTTTISNESFSMADVQIDGAGPAHPPQHTFTGILSDIDQQTPQHHNDSAAHSHDEADAHDRHSDKASSYRWSKPSSLEIDKSQPQDFDGELLTNNELPSAEVQKMIENYIVLDRHGKSKTFKSLYMGENKARRVLVIFIRHFFCGVCYLAPDDNPSTLYARQLTFFLCM